MKVLFNTEISQDKWRVFLKENIHASPFQSIEYFHLFNSVPGFSSLAVAVERSGSMIALVVIILQKGSGLKGFFSKRAIIYGGPLLNHNYPEALNLLLDAVHNVVNDHAIYYETRNLTDYTEFKVIFMDYGWDYLPYLNFQLNTIDMYSMTKHVSSSRMRQIKKALKSGVVWKEAAQLTDVNFFYNILVNLYKSKIRKPILPWEFFKEFFEQHIGKYFLVYFKDKVIGGIMCPLLDKRAIYEFYIAGLDTEYKEQYPSVMATWAAMEYANQQQIAFFDFMGAGSPDEEYGVRDFKARFGGEEIEYGRFRKINKPLYFHLGKAALKMYSLIS